jgi:hypothetical protein
VILTKKKVRKTKAMQMAKKKKRTKMTTTVKIV